MRRLHADSCCHEILAIDWKSACWILLNLTWGKNKKNIQCQCFTKCDMEALVWNVIGLESKQLSEN